MIEKSLNHHIVKSLNSNAGTAEEIIPNYLDNIFYLYLQIICFLEYRNHQKEANCLD